MNSKEISLFLRQLLFILTILFFKSEGLTDKVNAVLLTTLWIAFCRILEPIPISIFYGYKYLKIPDRLIVGIVMNFVSILKIFIMVYFFLFHGILKQLRTLFD